MVGAGANAAAEAMRLAAMVNFIVGWYISISLLNCEEVMVLKHALRRVTTDD